MDCQHCSCLLKKDKVCCYCKSESQSEQHLLKMVKDQIKKKQEEKDKK